MDISVEVCKDTYVVTCTPANPPSFLPECEHGWELGNGTAVCATEQPPSSPLAATGADPTAGVALGAALAVAGLLALALRRRKGA